MRYFLFLLFSTSFLFAESQFYYDLAHTFEIQNETTYSLKGTGILFLPIPPNQYGICTISHLDKGIILTAAHCIKDKPNIEDSFIIYLNKQNEKKVEKVSSILFSGSQELDIALLKINESASKNWDSLGKDFKKKEWNLFNSDSDPEKIKIWAYTPYKNKIGASFTPTTCFTSNRLPRVEMLKDKIKIQEFYFGNEKKNESLFFIDECDRSLIEGNSGALITMNTNVNQKLGVLSFYESETKKISRAFTATSKEQNGLEFIYYGTKGFPQRVSQSFEKFVLGLGTFLEVLTKNQPEIWSSF